MSLELLALLAGLFAGAIVAWVYDRQRLARVRARLLALEAASAANIAAVRSSADALATQRGRATSREAHDREARAQQSLEQTAQVLASREAALRELEGHIRARDERLGRREAVVREQAARARTLKRARHDIIVSRLARLAERAQTSLETVRAKRLQSEIDDGSRWVSKRALLRDEARNLDGEAARLLDMICARYDGIGHLERLSSTFDVSEAVGAALADDESEMATTLAQLVSCTWTVNGGAVTIRADDSAEREVARRLFKREWQTPAAMQGLVMSIKADIAREIAAAGREAFAVLGLPVAADEIVALVGRLKFRLSFSQNQWKHSIEVARLAGMMAGELGLDRVRSRRGGLLHDMGKAMTHDHEGAHAVLGATVARRNGEDEIVANAIGAHHNDEPMSSPVAFLVTAADALSGARPGARRESATAYVARVREIHEIASRGSLVQHVDVMQAGREVRVTVSSDAQDDALHPLAQRIARALEDEVAFPGQIRVTVIRESRVSAIAR